MKYRKKPIVIEAFRLGHDNIPDWAFPNEKLVIRMFHGTTDASITTKEGVMLGSHGDWLIKGIAGEIYPCAHEIFEATYDKVE